MKIFIFLKWFLNDTNFTFIYSYLLQSSTSRNLCFPLLSVKEIYIIFILCLFYFFFLKKTVLHATGNFTILTSHTVTLLLFLEMNIANFTSVWKIVCVLWAAARAVWRILCPGRDNLPMSGCAVDHWCICLWRVLPSCIASLKYAKIDNHFLSFCLLQVLFFFLCRCRRLDSQKLCIHYLFLFSAKGITRFCKKKENVFVIKLVFCSLNDIWKKKRIWFLFLSPSHHTKLSPECFLFHTGCVKIKDW